MEGREVAGVSVKEATRGRETEQVINKGKDWLGLSLFCVRSSRPSLFSCTPKYYVIVYKSANYMLFMRAL